MSKGKVRIRKINLSKVCRACLSEKGHLREIFSTKIPKMMEICADVEVSDEDELPSHICVSCFHLIAKFYTFKKKMEKSDRILRNYAKQNKVKQEDILNIAISKAEIEQQSVNDIVQIISDEDIPLSQRQIKKSYQIARESKVKSSKVTSDIFKHNKDNVEDISPKAENDEEETVNAVVLTDVPPPLVPLECKRSESPKCIDSGSIVKSLPADPPPLIPLTPLAITNNLLTNVIKNPIELNLKCNSCDKEFNSLQSLKEHKLNACTTSSLKCNICRKEFSQRKRLIGHLKGHMIVKNYNCKICGKCYPTRSTFEVHVRTHTGERPFKCQICNRGFVRWAGVVGHMRTHQSHKPYKCETCGKGFKISSNLERHKVLHSGNLPYCCNYCGKTFSQSDNLNLHIRTYHTNERPYLCNECGKGFVSSSRLKRHMWIHTGFKPYRCKSCPKAYTNSNDLKNHERNHLGNISNEDKPYACIVCDLRFYHQCRLNKHMKTHEKVFNCTICHKNFSSVALLSKHMTSKKNLHMQTIEERQVTENNDVAQIFLEY